MWTPPGQYLFGAWLTPAISLYSVAVRIAAPHIIPSPWVSAL